MDAGGHRDCGPGNEGDSMPTRDQALPGAISFHVDNPSTRNQDPLSQKDGAVSQSSLLQNASQRYRREWAFWSQDPSPSTLPFFRIVPRVGTLPQQDAS